VIIILITEEGREEKKRRGKQFIHCLNELKGDIETRSKNVKSLWLRPYTCLPSYRRIFFSAVGDSAFKKNFNFVEQNFLGDCLIFYSIGLGTFLRIINLYSA
jgi:hypothetical protein